jgi:hypothetical protein
MKINFNKQKIFEIIITALVGAGIAFLQGILTELLKVNTPVASPEIAGGIAGIIRTLRV